MKYTVVWKPSALNKLAEYWMAGADRDEITAASNRIDQNLKFDAHIRGESRSGSTRVLIEPPLVVALDVQELDRVATVLSIRYLL